MTIETLSPFIDGTVLTYFIALQTFQTVLLVLAVIEISRRQAERLPELDASVLLEDSTPPVTILVPAHNEETHIVETIRGLLRLKYRQFEILVINDGSSDGTLQRLRDAFQLQASTRPIQQALTTAPVRGLYHSTTHSNIWVLDKEKGGKSDALNAGINAARTPILCCLDADTMVTRDALLRMVESFIRDPQHVVAVGGTIRVANGCKISNGLVEEVGVPRSWLARFQLVEYLRAFVFGRLGFNRAGGTLIISGAFGLFARDAVIAVGGYDTKTVGEDMELIVKLHRHAEEHGGRVVQLSEPIAYTEVPENIRDLARQRARWHQGLCQTLWKHRSMIGRRRFGPAGRVLMPLFVIFECLGPVIELMGYTWLILAIVLGFIDPRFAVAFFLVAVLWGMILTVSSLIADRWTFRPDERERDTPQLLLVALIENLGYRQLTLFFRLRGLFRFFRRSKSWGEIKRKGYLESAPASSAEGSK